MTAFACPGVGNYEDQCNCTRYYQCGGDGVPVVKDCNTGTVYDTSIDGCNWDWDVDPSECVTVGTSPRY